MAGNLYFQSAYSSGTFISQIGSGTYDHLAFHGSDNTQAIDVNNYQDSSYIAQSDGTIYPVESGGRLLNVKYATSTTCDVSGWTSVDISNLNVFSANNLDIAPDFDHRPSGTIMIRYCSDAGANVNTYNAVLYAYDATGSQTDAAPDVTVMGFEINASGAWYSGQSGVWVNMEASSSPLHFVDHSSANNYLAVPEHIWVACISVRADAVGILDDFNFIFSFQYA